MSNTVHMYLLQFLTKISWKQRSHKWFRRQCFVLQNWLDCDINTATIFSQKFRESNGFIKEVKLRNSWFHEKIVPVRENLSFFVTLCIKTATIFSPKFLKRILLWINLMEKIQWRFSRLLCRITEIYSHAFLAKYSWK